MSTATNCLRCGALCRTGTPDHTKRAIVVSDTKGFCANCMITQFLLSIAPIADLINGSPARGDIVPAREGLGPEIFLNEPWREKTLRPILQAVLGHTQMPEDAIDWIEVVGNWGLDWPKNKAPGELF